MHCGNQGVRERDRATEEMKRGGNVYLPRINGPGISVHESDASRLFFWIHTHPVCIIGTWLIHRAASMDLVIPRCCHDQDL